MKNYTTILSMLLRLRQSCCHCSLVKLRDPAAEAEITHGQLNITGGEPGISGMQDELGDDVSLDELLARFREGANEEQDVVSTYGREVLCQIESEQGRECPICAAEPMVMEAVTVGCWHMACRQCILQHIEVKSPFPKLFSVHRPHVNLEFSSKSKEGKTQSVTHAVLPSRNPPSST